jgi:hypothetical protein
MQSFIKIPSISHIMICKHKPRINSIINMHKNKKINSSNIYKITFDNYDQDKEDLIQINKTIKRIIFYLMIIILIKIYVYFENYLYLPYY